MKKFLRIIVVFVFIAYISRVYGMSSEFKCNINELGVPEYNVKNMQLNEDIYLKYNIFVYGKPENVNSSEQRWKNLSNGNMTKNGKKGEYAVLGYDYASNLIYNYYFPLDRVTSTPVEKWQFLIIPGADKSWNEAYKYYTEEQVDYMKRSRWWFQNIKDGKNDPYDQIRYNLNAIKVGLNKCRLETPATWKTKGSIFTKRRTESGGVGWANFAIEPMSADAKVKSNISFKKEYTLDELSDQVAIPIKYGAVLDNLSEYAKAKHVKGFTSELFIDGKKATSVSGSKITSVGSEYILVISRNQIPQNKDYKIKINVFSFVKTEFLADGLLQDNIEVTLTINVEPKKVIPIEESVIKILSKDKNNWVVSPLAQNLNIVKSNSSGITEAGRCLMLRCKLNCNKEDIQNIAVNIDGVKVSDTKVLNSITKDLLVSFTVPNDTSPTVYGWKSLRDKTGNFFDINSNEVLTRKTNPHTIIMKYELHGNVYEEKILFDTIDDYISNMNNNILSKLNITRYGHSEVLREVICE